jgi:microcystin-dependent protein
MSEPYIGEIRMVGFNFAPVNWALCNGQQLSITENEALFNLIGTTYGGDGQQTFNLPNLQGCIALHQGNNQGNGYVPGQYLGAENVTVSLQQLPAHSHAVPCAATGNTASPANAVYAGDASQALYAVPDNSATLNNAALSTTGGSLQHTNQMPFVVINFVIALYGIFPPQN